MIYEGAIPGTATVGGQSDGGASISSSQAFDIPELSPVLARAPIRLQVRDSLTLMRVGARYAIAANGGRLRARGVGACATQLDQEGIVVQLSCMQTRPRPICLSAILYGPNGEHNPGVVNCDPDYRPYIPAPTNSLTLYGIEVPVRDPHGLVRYPVGPTQLDEAYLVVNFFAAQAHFTSTAVMPAIRLTDYLGR